jgi:hypothetical protein
VFYSGAWTCKSQLPRYVDNGDGTVSDNTTGLMWEKKTGTINSAYCPGNAADVHDVNNCFTWTATGTGADGTLFSTFLAALNADTSTDGSSTCFANHCDWRIPNIVELRSILSAPNPNCLAAPCIDPTFAPTASSTYWSSSSKTADPADAWYVGFADARYDYLYGKSTMRYAYAVRSGR